LSSDGLETISAAADPVRYLSFVAGFARTRTIWQFIPILANRATSFNHLLDRHADVLDDSILHAERETCLAVKTSLRGIDKQLSQRGFRLLNLVELRRGLYA
jgi:hypothetical protein